MPDAVHYSGVGSKTLTNLLLNMLCRQRSGERRVISYSLYNGHLPRYADGARENLGLWRTYFPGWEMWVYHDETTPNELLAELKAAGVKLINMTASALTNAMTWRFTVASDPSVDRYVIRDIDARLNQRDKDAIDEWCASGKKFHIIRDHPAHSIFKIPGGLWGGTKEAVPNMVDLLKRNAINASYMWDMHFLAREIWGQARLSAMQHDSFSCDRSGGRPFPTPRQYPEQHVGSVHLHAGAKERKVDSDRLIAAIRKGEQPVMCRDRGM